MKSSFPTQCDKTGLSANDNIADIKGLRHQSAMNLRFLLRRLLPHKRTTEAKALEAIVSCGIDPDDIAWRVDDCGSFIFGRKSSVDDELTYEQMECLLGWADSERVRTSVIGWETRQG